MTNPTGNPKDQQPSDTEDRLTELEIRFVRQDQLLEELSGVLYEQQKTIDDLKKKVRLLLEEKQSPAGSTPPPHEVPPHY